MAYTSRYKLRYLDRLDGAYLTRQVLQENAHTLDAAMGSVQDYVAGLAAFLGPVAGGSTQSTIGLDTDGVPYFDPSSAVLNPPAMGVDTDGVPYYATFTMENPPT